jgi:hypothetical protein
MCFFCVCVFVCVGGFLCLCLIIGWLIARYLSALACYAHSLRDSGSFLAFRFSSRGVRACRLSHAPTGPGALRPFVLMTRSEQLSQASLRTPPEPPSHLHPLFQKARCPLLVFFRKEIDKSCSQITSQRLLLLIGYVSEGLSLFFSWCRGQAAAGGSVVLERRAYTSQTLSNTIPRIAF